MSKRWRCVLRASCRAMTPALVLSLLLAGNSHAQEEKSIFRNTAPNVAYTGLSQALSGRPNRARCTATDRRRRQSLYSQHRDRALKSPNPGAKHCSCSTTSTGAAGKAAMTRSFYGCPFRKTSAETNGTGVSPSSAAKPCSKVASASSSAANTIQHTAPFFKSVQTVSTV